MCFMSINTSSLAAFLATISLTCLGQEPDADLVDTTIVEAKPIPINDSNYDFFPPKSSAHLANEASMLLHIPGLTLTERSGPQGLSELHFRGLSASRFKVDLEGLSLNDPMQGFSDANAMFLFAASHLHGGGQSLSVNLPTFEEPYAKGIFGLGSQSAIKAGASIGHPLGKYQSVFAAMQVSSTEGDFSFSSPYLKKDDPNNNFKRKNNDHHRLQGLVKFQRNSPKNDAHALFAFHTYEGGVAGYASSPNEHLRNHSSFFGLSTGASQKIDSAEFYFQSSNSLFKYEGQDLPENNNEEFLTTTHELSLGIRPIKWFKRMDFDLAQQIVVERAYELDKTRLGAGFVMKRTSYFQGRLKPQLFSNFTMIAYQKHGLIFKKDLGLTIEPTNKSSLTFRWVRSQRLPTFMELYANNSFFVGNPDLEKESIMDIEIASNIKIGSSINLRALAFLGYISDTIVYVPLFAKKKQPINTKSTNRYGFDFSLSYEPLNWLLFETNNSFLYTKVRETDAPLPQAPPFLGLSKVRLGPDDFINVTLQSRYRGPSTANLSGTIKTDPYILVDAVLRTPIYKKLQASFSVNNIFNITTARDTYEMPLPGTVFFGQIELENI